MGAKYDGIHWDPPPYERHVWRNLRPRRPASLRIYEAHVGMSSEEDTVATYTYFKGGVGGGLMICDGVHVCGVCVDGGGVLRVCVDGGGGLCVCVCAAVLCVGTVGLG